MGEKPMAKVAWRFSIATFAQGSPTGPCRPQPHIEPGLADLHNLDAKLGPAVALKVLDPDRVLASRKRNFPDA